MTVEEYIKYRIGTIQPLKAFGRIFTKPFQASSLRKFWWYWNPGYGYFLLFYCYRPLRGILSHSWALLATFLICGLFHDLLYIVPMAIMDNGKLPLPFVTIWFLLNAVGIIITEYARISFKNLSHWFRPVVHLGFLSITFAMTMFLSSKI